MKIFVGPLKGATVLATWFLTKRGPLTSDTFQERLPWGEIRRMGLPKDPSYGRVVPSRETASRLCYRHRQEVTATGVVIVTENQNVLVVADVAVCDICTNRNKWDARINGWLSGHPQVGAAEKYTISPPPGKTVTPCEWALQAVDALWGHSNLGWNKAEMRDFLEGRRENPPLTMLDQGGREVIDEIAGFITREPSE